MTKSRLKLLMTLENIIGNKCYHPKMRNRDAEGDVSEGREFRYPITFIDANGEKMKRWAPDASISPEVALTGYYAFGANELQVIRALDQVVAYLERNYNLKLDDTAKAQLP